MWIGRLRCFAPYGRAIASFSCSFVSFLSIFNSIAPCVSVGTSYMLIALNGGLGGTREAYRISAVSHREWKMASIKCNDLTDEHHTFWRSSSKWVLHRKPATFAEIYGKSLVVASTMQSANANDYLFCRLWVGAMCSSTRMHFPIVCDAATYQNRSERCWSAANRCYSNPQSTIRRHVFPLSAQPMCVFLTISMAFAGRGEI